MSTHCTLPKVKRHLINFRLIFDETFRSISVHYTSKHFAFEARVGKNKHWIIDSRPHKRFSYFSVRKILRFQFSPAKDCPIWICLTDFFSRRSHTLCLRCCAARCSYSTESPRRAADQCNVCIHFHIWRSRQLYARARAQTSSDVRTWTSSIGKYSFIISAIN